MKALLMRITVGVFALGALFYFLACTPPTPNNNAGQNVSPNSNHANGNQANGNTLTSLQPCDSNTNPGTHGQQMKHEMKDKMSPALKKLYKDADNPDGTFTIEITQATGGTYYIGRIKGKISGDDNLKELSDILNDFQSKQECLRVIYFVPPDGASATAEGEPGFEWSSCEYPMHVCPNGECCSTIEANTNSNTNQIPHPPIVNGNRTTNTNH